MGDAAFPILSRPAVHFIRFQHAAIGVFPLPYREGKLVVVDEFQLAALEGAKDGGPGDLLPPTSAMVVGHDEVLVIDAAKLEPELSAVHDGPPHDAGVAQRSVSGDERDAADHVVDEMVIGQLALGVGDRLAVQGHGQDQIVVVEEVDRFRLREAGNR